MKVASKDLQDFCDGSAAAAPDAETVPGLINTLIDETQGSTLLEDAYGPELPGEVDPEKLPEVDPEKDQLPDESEGGQGAAASSEKQGPKPKRKRLRDMTPESKKKEEQRRVMAKRANSLAWHQKWVSKGVQKDASASATDSGAEAEDAGPAAATAADDAGPGVPDTRKAMQDFCKKWVEQSDLPKGNDRRERSKQAWMESDVRAQLMARRSKQQF